MHLCPECEAECGCHGDTSEIVVTDFPADCAHCAEAEDDDVDDVEADEGLDDW